uniref:Periviscerokinin-1 n=2 Tax=Musca domestica TaxID=7370 RepID=PVK1_MUSDO|nr:RecName: Full=Periviscerokinin-1; AltName: Full=Musdo-PVK-1 [Musca domestica]
AGGTSGLYAFPRV